LTFLPFVFLFFLFPLDVRPIAISKQLILKETVRNLQYEVYGYGFVIESADIMRVWIEMEVPFSSMFFGKRREKFYSDEAFGRYEVMEGTCDAAISHQHKKYFALVQDINFHEVRCLEQRALAPENWSNLLYNVVDGARKDNEA
jgi:hypothetical protein